MKYSVGYWQRCPGVDPAFWPYCVDKTQFGTAEEAEAYGQKLYGEYYAGAQQVSWANDEKPF